MITETSVFHPSIQADAVQVRKVGRAQPARLTAAQLAWTCWALVAPNSTLVTRSS
jgi:hypothetical protein